jgi:hypothetical protein
MKTYQILARGDFKSWHKTLSAAIRATEKLTGYERGEVKIYEVPEGGEMEIDCYPLVWSN